MLTAGVPRVGRRRSALDPRAVHLLPAKASLMARPRVVTPSRMGRSSAHVVVIGAGVQGLSAAYYLTSFGITDVVVVEKSRIGAGSSSRSASMLMLQRESEPKIRLSQYSYSRFMEFGMEMGVGIGFRRIGSLSIVPEGERAVALERASLRKQLGVRTNVLTPSEIVDMVPQLNVDDIACGIFGPDDGVFKPQAIMDGYSQKAVEHGAAVELRRLATGIRVEGHRVVGVETNEGFISGPFVVNAAGADAIEVAHWVGAELPLENATRSIYLTGPTPSIRDDVPLVEDAGAHWYFRREGAGVLIGMGREKHQPASDTPNLEFLPTVREFAKHRVPILADFEVAGGWSGIRPLTPDLTPILGPIDGVEGFVNSCGWGGEGIMHAPAGGSIVASFIAGKKHPQFDLEPFLLSRFQTSDG
jgi:sarcosine oxidase subunit beta